MFPGEVAVQAMKSGGVSLPMGVLFSEQVEGVSVEEGYSRCAELARTHYENFSVGSWLLPGDKRRHIYAVYAFCRFVDDLGDEYEGDRLKALDAWEKELTLCYEGTPMHPYMVALQETIRTFEIPRTPFLKLIEANRMDQVNTRYATFEDLEHYCRHSANPVGQMVLYVFGYRDQERHTLSDYTCTALQLTNFWQDVVRDYAMGRIYIPQEDMERFGYSEAQIADGVFNPEFRDLMVFEVERARGLFRQGLKLIDTLDGRFRLDVALFSLGGMKVLDAIEGQGFDVLSRRPVLSKGAKLRLMLGATLRFGLGLKV